MGGGGGGGSESTYRDMGTADKRRNQPRRGVEAHVLRALRTKDGIRMAAVRKSIDYAEQELGIKRLLLSEELCTSGQDRRGRRTGNPS